MVQRPPGENVSHWPCTGADIKLFASVPALLQAHPLIVPGQFYCGMGLILPQFAAEH
jgi:hypothetical protein